MTPDDMTAYEATTVPPVDASPVQPDASYDHALYGSAKPWRGIVAILVLVVSLLVLSLVFSSIALAVEILNGTMDLGDPDSLLAITPLILLSSNLALAALIPISMGLQRLLFGVRVRFLSSVTGKFRGRWMGRLALIIVPIWVLYIGLSFVLEPGGEIRIDGTVVALLAVVVLTTPLQAAGEEFGFRGLVQRSAGSWFRNPKVAFAVSTFISGALFGAAHFAADPWLIAYYFLFGVSASIAARLTGGLEAPILVHIVNNVFIFVPAALLGQLSEGIDRSEGAGGPFMLLPIAVCLGAAFLSGWWARRSRVATHAPRPLTRAEELQAASPPPVVIP